MTFLHIRIVNISGINNLYIFDIPKMLVNVFSFLNFVNKVYFADFYDSNDCCLLSCSLFLICLKKKKRRRN